MRRAITPADRTENLLRYFGWQGGTIHQLAKETGCSVQDLLYATCENKGLVSEHTSGHFALRTCSLDYRLKFVEKKYGVLDFWLGVAESLID